MWAGTPRPSVLWIRDSAGKQKQKQNPSFWGAEETSRREQRCGCGAGRGAGEGATARVQGASEEPWTRKGREATRCPGRHPPPPPATSGGAEARAPGVRAGRSKLELPGRPGRASQDSPTFRCCSASAKACMAPGPPRQESGSTPAKLPCLRDPLSLGEAASRPCELVSHSHGCPQSEGPLTREKDVPFSKRLGRVPKPLPSTPRRHRQALLPSQGPHLTEAWLDTVLRHADSRRDPQQKHTSLFQTFGVSFVKG